MKVFYHQAFLALSFASISHAVVNTKCAHPGLRDVFRNECAEFVVTAGSDTYGVRLPVTASQGIATIGTKYDDKRRRALPASTNAEIESHELKATDGTFHLTIHRTRTNTPGPTVVVNIREATTTSKNDQTDVDNEDDDQFDMDAEDEHVTTSTSTVSIAMATVTDTFTTLASGVILSTKSDVDVEDETVTTLTSTSTVATATVTESSTTLASSVILSTKSDVDVEGELVTASTPTSTVATTTVTESSTIPASTVITSTSTEIPMQTADSLSTSQVINFSAYTTVSSLSTFAASSFIIHVDPAAGSPSSLLRFPSSTVTTAVLTAWPAKTIETNTAYLNSGDQPGPGINNVPIKPIKGEGQDGKSVTYPNKHGGPYCKRAKKCIVINEVGPIIPCIEDLQNKIHALANNMSSLTFEPNKPVACSPAHSSKYYAFIELVPWRPKNYKHESLYKKMDMQPYEKMEYNQVPIGAIAEGIDWIRQRDAKLCGASLMPVPAPDSANMRPGSKRGQVYTLKLDVVPHLVEMDPDIRAAYERLDQEALRLRRAGS